MDGLRRSLTDRLAVLEREWELGQERLRALENETMALRQTVLRIDGAMQVLREVLDGPVDTPGDERPHAPAGHRHPHGRSDAAAGCDHA